MDKNQSNNFSFAKNFSNDINQQRNKNTVTEKTSTLYSHDSKFGFTTTTQTQTSSQNSRFGTLNSFKSDVSTPTKPSVFGQSMPQSPFSTGGSSPFNSKSFATQQTSSSFGTGGHFNTSTSHPTSSFDKKPALHSNESVTRHSATTKPFVSLRTQNQPPSQSPSSVFSRSVAQAQDKGNSSAGRTSLSEQKGFSNRFTSNIGTQTFSTSGSTLTKEPIHSTSPFRKDLHITDEEFLLLRDFIYQQCGIFIAENRKYLVENRLSNRIKEHNLKSYGEYYNFLRFDTNRKQELTKLFEVVTTNETSFFRNPPQLEVFQRVVLGEVFDKLRKSGHKKLRIWSAGCSTGEEPYTLSIIIHEVLKSEVKQWDIKITANDLSEAVLAAAKRGIYNEYALRTTPKEIVDKYFHKEGNIYKVDPEIQRIVSFGQINLNDKEQLKKVEKSQIIFCRNVIIYFDDDMKRRVINSFYDNLLLDGILIIGHSETLHGISRAFTLDHHKGTILYRKTN